MLYLRLANRFARFGSPTAIARDRDLLSHVRFQLQQACSVAPAMPISKTIRTCRPRQGAGLATTVDPSLMRGLVPHDLASSWSCPSLVASVGNHIRLLEQPGILLTAPCSQLRATIDVPPQSPPSPVALLLRRRVSPQRSAQPRVRSPPLAIPPASPPEPWPAPPRQSPAVRARSRS